MTTKDLGRFLSQEEVKNYGIGLRLLLESGRLRPKPLGNRVHLYAILPTDATTTFAPAGIDVASAVVHKVIDVGPDVKNPNIKAGMHVVHISTAGSGMDDDRSNRFSSVAEEDLLMYWDPKDIDDA